jgi:hypothetical protein
MKKFSITIIFILAGMITFSQDSKISTINPTKKLITVNAACGECQFKMKGSGCTLAVKMKKKTYFVDGTTIDAHGDAHSETGFCNAIRKAKVQGEVVNNKFVASYFKLIDEKENK